MFSSLSVRHAFASCASLLVFGSLCADVSSTSGNVYFDVDRDGTAEYVMNSSGFGIGTLNPSANLQVTGNVHFEGPLTLLGLEQAQANHRSHG